MPAQHGGPFDQTERKVGKDENRSQAFEEFQHANLGKTIIVVTDNEKGTRMIASDRALENAGEDARRQSLGLIPR